jgi:decaprenyl-phosphate phosphoribosyltransferase
MSSLDDVRPWPVDDAQERRRFAGAVLETARPRQWVKNGLVVAAAGAAGALGHDDVPGRVGAACIAFVMLSAGVYFINDVRDAAEDRLHPRKRHRPVAAGHLSARGAVALGVLLIVSGLVLCAAIRPLLAVIGAAYIALTLSYTLLWRHVIVLDLFAIAGGFVLRALAGGVAASVHLSRWFLLVVTFSAICVAGGKRYAELSRAGRRPGHGRRVLDGYTPGGLRALLSVSAAGALFTYAMWAFQRPLVDGVPWRPLSILPLAAGLARYLNRVRAGDGEAPEQLLLADRVLLVLGLVWLVVFALGVHEAT